MRVQTVAGPIIAINSPSGLWIQNSRHNVALKLADHSSDKIHKTGTLQQLHCILNIGQDEIKSVACKSISMIICEIFTVMISSQFDWRESFCADPSHYWSRGEGPVLAKWMGHANNSCQKQIYVLAQIQITKGNGGKEKYKVQGVPAMRNIQSNDCSEEFHLHCHKYHQRASQERHSNGQQCQ